jgi:hypothetical protein
MGGELKLAGWAFKTLYESSCAMNVNDVELGVQTSQRDTARHS